MEQHKRRFFFQKKGGIILRLFISEARVRGTGQALCAKHRSREKGRKISNESHTTMMQEVQTHACCSQGMSLQQRDGPFSSQSSPPSPSSPQSEMRDRAWHRVVWVHQQRVATLGLCEGSSRLATLFKNLQAQLRQVPRQSR